ncbi:MAG: hypothetical protein JO022_14725 [Acidobacteriaceae bacterium]|nr:hypothetical protein [Acidobacteriaceae bacterium]
MPNVEIQREAMSKLQFLAGTWSGAGRIWKAPDNSIEILQTEHAAFKLEGLLLTIEGAGKTKSDGRIVLQAFGLLSYDDDAGVYRMRAFNDGRWLETEVVLDHSDHALHWGFRLGQISTDSPLNIDEHGDWTELHQLTMGSEPPRLLMEIAVQRDSSM